MRAFDRTLYALPRLPGPRRPMQSGGMHPLPTAHAAALIAVHQLLVAAKSHPPGSAVCLDCAGAAEDIALTMEAYAHLWTGTPR